jgi:hypothetical protein
MRVIEIVPQGQTRRGLALLIALVILSGIVALIFMLTRATLSRVKVKRSQVWREDRVRIAEGALLRGRLALESGKLNVGSELKLGPVAVASTKTEKGVRLETVVPPDADPAKKKPANAGTKTKKERRGRRGIRVQWLLAQDTKTKGWRRVDWLVEELRHKKAVKRGPPQKKKAALRE